MKFIRMHHTHTYTRPQYMLTYAYFVFGSHFELQIIYYYREFTVSNASNTEKNRFFSIIYFFVSHWIAIYFCVLSISNNDGKWKYKKNEANFPLLFKRHNSIWDVLLLSKQETNWFVGFGFILFNMRDFFLHRWHAYKCFQKWKIISQTHIIISCSFKVIDNCIWRLTSSAFWWWSSSLLLFFKSQ